MLYHSRTTSLLPSVRTGVVTGWASATSTARSSAYRRSPTSSRWSGTSRRRSPRRATRCRPRSTTSSPSPRRWLANGDTPLCVGIESSAATGWPFTDWVEDLVLRNQGVDFYNQWVNHEVPFNSPEVVETFQQVGDLWNGEGMTYAVRWVHRLDELPGERRTTGQRRLHDAPPGELLRRHRRPVRRVRRGGRPVQLLLLPVQRGTAHSHRWIGSWQRSATHPRSGP